jgi:hypothetical protein
MGAVNTNQQIKIIDKVSQAKATVLFMDTEMRFRRPEFAEAFEKKISEEAKKRLWAYYKTSNSIDAILLLGLSCGFETWRKRLAGIAKQLGASSLPEVFDSKEEKDVLLIEDQTGSHKINGRFLRGLIEKQQFRCALSGQFLTPNEAALDHVLPYEAGGRHEPDNVQWVHQDVNNMKGQMRQEVFLQWCVKIAEHAKK